MPAKDRPDIFGPFICVTNSYNTVRALRFDIGYFRKVCANGLIIPDAIVKIHFVHSRRTIGDKIKFDVARERLTKFRNSFADLLGALRDCSVPRSLFEPLTLGALLFHEPKGADTNGRRAKDWALLKAHIRKVSDHYAGELGENAYAVFNTITVFASRPSINRSVQRERHSFQQLAGKWLSVFSRECREPGFKIDGYLMKLVTTSGRDAASNIDGRTSRRPQLLDDASAG